MSGFESLLQKFGGVSDDSTELPPQQQAGGLEAFIQRHGAVSETYAFYNGTVELRFDKEEHRYYLVSDLGNLEPVDGVTTVCGIVDKSHMLVPWASKMAIQKMLRLIPTEMVEGIVRIKPLTFEEFTTLALEAKSAHKDKLDEASDTGHAAHACIEDSIKQALTTDPEQKVRTLINLPSDERAANAANSAKAWMDQHNVRWLATERKVYSKKHNFAGTLDGVAFVDSCLDRACCSEIFQGRLSLIDWKSSNSLKVDYLVQTAAYLSALLEELVEYKP